MEVKTVITGTLEENCYILIKKGECLVIDPGSDYQVIKKVIGDNKVLGVLITHSHFDHVGALRNFLSKKGIKIFKKSNILEKEYNIGNFTFNCIYTPGHSSDSITFYFKEIKAMFVGDFIFKNNIGRCDLPTGSIIEMKKSIEKIKKYDDDIIIYNGHGACTILLDEKKNNPYFNGGIL